MTTKIQNLRFDGSDVQVSVVQLAGTQDLSGADRLRDRAVNALSRPSSQSKPLQGAPQRRLQN